MLSRRSGRAGRRGVRGRAHFSRSELGHLNFLLFVFPRNHPQTPGRNFRPPI